MRRGAPHDSCDDRSARSCVGMPFSTLCVAKRTQSVRKGMRRGAPHDSCDDRSARSSVGMQFSTLCVARGRRASGKACDAERRTIVVVIVPHAPAWECRSRRSASPRGRRASGKACDAERRTIVAMIVPHAPAWECRSRRSASPRGRRCYQCPSLQPIPPAKCRP
jgi:hypothetical protein